MWGKDVSAFIPDIVPTFCIWREASGEGVPGMTAVAWVIQNRCIKRKQSALQVCIAPFQFSSMNAPHDPGMLRYPLPEDDSFRAAYAIWRGVQSNTIPDPTGGADLYYATSISAPHWATSGQVAFTVQIGKQKFFRELT